MWTVGWVAGALWIIAAPSFGQDPPGAVRDLHRSDDVRLRVSAALYLGKAKAPGTRGELEHALDDEHPSVRIAAAAALRVFGDASAVGALERRRAREGDPSVRKQLDAALSALAQPAALAPKRAKYMVQVGAMVNRSAAREDQLATLLADSTREHVRDLPGAWVTNADDAAALRTASQRKLPVLGLDGALTKLSQAQMGGDVAVTARVEFTLRRMPGQLLRGTLTGSATAVGSSASSRTPKGLAALQVQAVESAVQGALRGADAEFARAARGAE
jgi:hypothetical protein